MGRDGKPTRDKILSESKGLIYKNGFSGTSIDLILSQTGITKGAFFYHFKTKADLALALMQDYAETELNLLAESKETVAHLPPRERLLSFIQIFIDMFSGVEDPPSCLFASVSNEQNQYSEETKEIISQTMLKWRQAFVEMINEVIIETETNERLDKIALADHLNVVMEGAFVLSKALGDPSVTARHLVLLKNYFELLFEKKI